MMEIKCRAWDKKEKKMFLPYEPVLSGHISTVLENNGEIYGIEEIGENPERYELMLFTGLKDKNGKEIYVGDIIKSIGAYYGVDAIYEVFFDKGMFCVRYIKPKDKFETALFVTSPESCVEIIGNIYQNPELLKGE